MAPISRSGSKVEYPVKASGIGEAYQRLTSKKLNQKFIDENTGKRILELDKMPDMNHEEYHNMYHNTWKAYGGMCIITAFGGANLLARGFEETDFAKQIYNFGFAAVAYNLSAVSGWISGTLSRHRDPKPGE